LTEKKVSEQNILAKIHEKSNEDLRTVLDELYAEEKRISYERRVLHGKIDILRAELVERLKKEHKKGKSVITGKDVERLTEILSKGLR